MKAKKAKATTSRGAKGRSKQLKGGAKLNEVKPLRVPSSQQPLPKPLNPQPLPPLKAF
jgi:hypothetical protein